MSAAKSKHNAPKTLVLGPMPHESLNKILGLELLPGKIVFSVAAQIHAQKRHPKDYSNCLPFAGSIATSPLYVGDDFRNPGKIECVSRVPALGTAVLVALCIEPDANGDYHVTSIYPVSFKKVQARLAKGHLKPLK